MSSPVQRAAWTGGQFSLVRVGYALALGAVFARASVVGTGPALAAAAAAGLVAAMFLALGAATRLAALAAAAALVALEVVPGGALALGRLLLAAGALALALPHAAPYGSLAARGRTDPAGAWRLPRAFPGLVWSLLAVALLASAALEIVGARAVRGVFVARDVGPGVPFLAASRVLPALEAALALMCARARWRPLVFGALIALTAATAVAPWGRADVLALLPLWWLAVDPGWWPPRPPRRDEWVFYDGTCGLCHATVRLLLAEAPEMARLRFAPLGSRTFERIVGADVDVSQADSVVVRTDDGLLLIRSRATWHLLDRLGGLWRPLARLGRALPRPLGDTGYRCVARLRRVLFRRPETVCPRLPPHLVQRFAE